jgi:hypothetical protein
MYTIIFHDAHGFVNNTKEALTSSITPHTTILEVAQQPVRPHISSPPLIPENQDEEPYKTDDGTLPPDLVPIDEYVAICLSVRDQSRDMIEFLNHHYHHHQIRRFYIME